MYKLLEKKNPHNSAKYFVCDVEKGNYMDADETMVKALIGTGQVLFATVENDNIIIVQTEEDKKSEKMLEAIYRRLGAQDNVMYAGGFLYFVEESILEAKPVAILSLDPYRRVLASLECDVSNERYMSGLKETFLNPEIVQACRHLKEEYGGKKKMLRIGNYHDGINSFHVVELEDNEFGKIYYPCEPNSDKWKSNIKFHICPKESTERPSGMPNEVYQASSLIVRNLEEEKDIYCSKFGEFMYVHCRKSK